MDSGFQVLDSSLCQWNLDSGFQSFVGFRIPRLSCIPDSKTQDSRFNKQTIHGFQNPDFLTWGGKYPAILNEQDWSITHICRRLSFNRHPVRFTFPIRQSPQSVFRVTLKYTYFMSIFEISKSDTLRCNLLRRRWMV